MSTAPASSHKVLVLGATGMLGNAMLRSLADQPGIEVVGTARSAAALRALPEVVRPLVRTGIDVENFDSLARLLDQVRPTAIVNCIGLVKQLADANDPLAALPINALLPHRLARLAALVGARFVHVSTDCVFSGSRGGYRESDAPDAGDLYGRSKLLGEVTDQRHAITLRTSIIGHELASAHGLIGWFLNQRCPVKGYARAVFSGLPTVELSRVVRDFVLPRTELHGLYQVASQPIDKLTLLRLVARQYGHDIEITPDDKLVIDRSLDSSRFKAATGYQAPDWSELVRRMYTFA